MAFGTVSVSASARTVDVGFAPDLVIGWNEINGATGAPAIWISNDTSNNKTFNGSYGVTASFGGISVSGDIITFTDGGINVNNNVGGVNMYYFAIKFNKTDNPS